MNITIVLRTIEATLTHLDALLLDEAADKKPPFFSEKQLQAHANKSEPWFRTWVFFCRAQRFLFMDGNLIQKTSDADGMEETQHYLVDFLSTLDQLPENIKTFLIDDFSATQVLYFTLLKTDERLHEPLIKHSNLLYDNIYKNILLNKKMNLESFQDTQLKRYALETLKFYYDILNILSNSLSQQFQRYIDQPHLTDNDVGNIFKLLAPLIQLNKKISALCNNTMDNHLSDQYRKTVLRLFFKHLSRIISFAGHASESRAMMNEFLKWALLKIVKEGLDKAEDYYSFSQIYNNSVLNIEMVDKFIEFRYAVIKEFLKENLFDAAFHFLHKLLTMQNAMCMQGHYLKYAPRLEDTNLAGLLCYLNALKTADGTLSKGLAFISYEKNIVDTATFKNVEPSIIPIIQEVVPVLLETIAENYLQEKELDLKRTLFNIYERLNDSLSTEDQRYFNIIFNPEDFFQQLSQGFFAKPAMSQKNLKSAQPAYKPVINIPEAVIDFCKQIESSQAVHWVLCGSAVFELEKGVKPNDYDLMAIGITCDDLALQLDKKRIAYQRFGSDYPIIVLSIEKEFTLEISCHRNPSNKKLKDYLIQNYKTRDFKPCALYAEVPTVPQPTLIISHHQALSLSHKKIIETIDTPSKCFSEDPLRVLRLIKWQLKHPEFRLHHRLQKFIIKTNTSWLELFNKKNAREPRYASRFRTALLQMLNRFTLDDLLKNELFVKVLADLSQLSRETVVSECHFVQETLDNRNNINRLMVYLVFNLFVAAKKEDMQKAMPLKDLLFFFPRERDLFSSFIQSHSDNQNEHCDTFICDPMYQTLLKHHQLEEKTSLSLTG